MSGFSHVNALPVFQQRANTMLREGPIVSGACVPPHPDIRGFWKYEVKGSLGESNDSVEDGFILVGFSDRPQLEMVLFAVNLPLYVVAVLGNSTIILLCVLDPGLHTPMYFFLAHLSFLDLCFSTSCIPQMLVHLRGPAKTISFAGCTVQLSSFLTVGGVECLLLAVMAYDRYAAVCRPLHYAVLLRPGLCCRLVAAAWGSGLLNAGVMSPLTMVLPRCGRRRVPHFLCEMPALIKMACADARAVEMLAFAFAVLIVLLPLALILVSYGHIAAAVRRIRSAAGRWKAFNTCSSHLAVVSLFYGSIIYMYMQPGNSSSRDRGKFATLFYNLGAPVLNPLIYALRNQEVRAALRKVSGRPR
ncbi:putative olfactory receptor 2W6 [Marmota monax]|uniref:putative olfactory receptor 2W6 n=1 Tax=Marmota monax TaxID=9995 RepID=UPI001EB0184C|nr:putative olfactory receptor 2W6 [Marmota monax]